HAKVVSVDVTAADKMPGVKAVHIVQGPGMEIHWAGDDIAVVAAVDEATAADAARAIKVEYEPLQYFVDDFMHPDNVAEDTGPLSLDDVVGMLRNQMPDPQIIDRVQKRGLSFKVEDEMVGQMKQRGISDAVISALQSAPQKPAQEKPKSPYKK